MRAITSIGKSAIETELAVDKHTEADRRETNTEHTTQYTQSGSTQHTELHAAQREIRRETAHPAANTRQCEPQSM